MRGEEMETIVMVFLLQGRGSSSLRVRGGQWFQRGVWVKWAGKERRGRKACWAHQCPAAIEQQKRTCR